MTISLFFQFLLAIVVVEAITGIITKSEIFSPIREFFFDRRENKIFHWIHELLDCGYCTSVWIGGFVSIGWFYFDSKILKVIFLAFALHRLSNMLHFIIDRLDRTREIDLEDFTEKENNNEHEGFR